MRNLTAERKVIEKLFVASGAFFLIGVIALAFGTQWGIIENTAGPLFWTLEGLWAVLLGITLGLIGNATKQGQ